MRILAARSGKRQSGYFVIRKHDEFYYERVRQIRDLSYRLSSAQLTNYKFVIRVSLLVASNPSVWIIFSLLNRSSTRRTRAPRAIGNWMRRVNQPNALSNAAAGRNLLRPSPNRKSARPIKPTALKSLSSWTKARDCPPARSSTTPPATLTSSAISLTSGA